jgi:hypothetical protein
VSWNNRLYGENWTTLTGFDLSNPIQPVATGQMNLAERIYALEVSGDNLYLLPGKRAEALQIFSFE